MAGLVGRTFTYDFTGPIASVWTAMADTARYNEAAGLPRHIITEQATSEGDITFHSTARMGPFDLAWEDIPCNWVRESWFEHKRCFERGPFRWLIARFELEPLGQGCRGSYRIEVEPASVAGRALLMGGFMRSGEQMFHRLAAQADQFARGQAAAPFESRPPTFTAGQRARLDSLIEALAVTRYSHGLAQRLGALITEASDLDVQRIRPLALARLWGAPPGDVIETCLQATRLGLLELRWDLLCPRCRGAKSRSSSLDLLPTGAHCNTCNIDYNRDFSRNVELAFRPNESIRDVVEGEFCLLGPMSTPHIWAHLTLQPGETRTVECRLPPGDYRLRTLEAGPEADLRYEGGPFPAVILTPASVRAGVPAAPGTLALENRSDRHRTLVVEERSWARDALTADRVVTLQAFRDLFSTDVLRPGDEVSVRRVTLLFSDLKGSTALYERIGDATAYKLVREHFAYLAGIVREHEGAIVKTIGDAVMAAFHDPLQGLRAAIAMQERVTRFNATASDPIVLKLGLHEGPCIAVTLNDRLDYFGQAANLAARLQGESKGADIVLSMALAENPAAAPLIDPLRPVEETASLRGIAEPVRFVRLHVDAADLDRTVIEPVERRRAAS